MDVRRARIWRGLGSWYGRVVERRWGDIIYSWTDSALRLGTSECFSRTATPSLWVNGGEGHHSVNSMPGLATNPGWLFTPMSTLLDVVLTMASSRTNETLISGPRLE